MCIRIDTGETHLKLLLFKFLLETRFDLFTGRHSFRPAETKNINQINFLIIGTVIADLEGVAGQSILD